MVILNRVSQINKVNEVDVRTILNFGNNNYQKVALAFARMCQSIQISEEFRQVLNDLIQRKISILQKGKGKQRMSIDELKAFDIIINDILETSPESEGIYIKEYTQLFEQFIDHFSNLYLSYQVNEDVIGILKFIYLNDSKYFSKAREAKLKEMDKISTNILPKHLEILNSCLKIVIFDHNQNDEEIEENEEVEENEEKEEKEENEGDQHKIDNNKQIAENKLEIDSELLANQIDQKELLRLVEAIYSYLPSSEFHKNLLIDQIETRICKKFNKMKPNYILKYVNLTYKKLGGIGFEILSKLEEQFLKGKIVDLSPRQIAQLMRV